jgi:hypothetical protein
MGECDISIFDDMMNSFRKIEIKPPWKGFERFVISKDIYVAIVRL